MEVRRTKKLFPIRWTKHKMAKKLEDNFIRNGSLLQEELISFCNGNNFPIQVFSAKEVMKMSDFTQNQLIGECSTFKLFKGVLENRSISIKRFHSLFAYVGMEGIIREIVVATQMSVHKNALKLLGCCLETDFPVLVYELTEHGCLAQLIYTQDHGLDRVLQSPSLPWKTRLRIGYEISYALAYLQNGFRRPVIHRNLSAKDVFLDKDFVAKVTGFYLSVSIPEGEVLVNDAIVGTNGHSAPEYITSGRLTGKTDVFLFGTLFLELLVGRQRKFFVGQDLASRARDLREGRIMDMIVEPAIVREVEQNGQQQQLQEVFDLVLRCSAQEEDDRPSIVDVADDLKQILTVVTC